MPDHTIIFDEHIRQHQHIAFNLAIGVGGTGFVKFQLEIDQFVRSLLGELQNPPMPVFDEFFHGEIFFPLTCATTREGAKRH